MLPTRPPSRPQLLQVPQNIHLLPFITARAPHQPILRARTAPQPQQSCPCLKRLRLLGSMQFSVQYLPAPQFPPRTSPVGLLSPPLCPTGPMCEASSTHFTPRPSLPRSVWASEPLCYDSVTLLSDPAGQRSDRSCLPSGCVPSSLRILGFLVALLQLRLSL